MEVESDIFKPLVSRFVSSSKGGGVVATHIALKAKCVEIGRDVEDIKGVEAREDIVLKDVVVDFSQPSGREGNKKVNCFSFSGFNYENTNVNPGLVDISRLKIERLNDESSNLTSEVVLRPAHIPSLKWLPESLLDWSVEMILNAPINKGQIQLEDLIDKLTIKPRVFNILKKIVKNNMQVVTRADGVVALKLPVPALPPIVIPGLAGSIDPNRKGVINIHQAISEVTYNDYEMIAIDHELMDFLSGQPGLDECLNKMASYFQGGKTYEAIKCAEQLTCEQVDNLSDEQVVRFNELLNWLSEKLLQNDRAKAIALFKKIHRVQDDIPFPFFEKKLDRLSERKSDPDYKKMCKEYVKPLLFVCKEFPGAMEPSGRVPLLLQLVSRLQHVDHEKRVLIPPETISTLLSQLMDEKCCEECPEVLAQALVTSGTLLDKEAYSLVLGHVSSKTITALIEQVRSDWEKKEICEEFFNALIQNGQAEKNHCCLEVKSRPTHESDI